MFLRLKLKNCKFTVFTLEEGKADTYHGHEDVYQMSIPLLGRSLMQHEKTSRYMESPESRMFLSPGQSHRHLAADNKARILLITIKKHFVSEVVADHMPDSDMEVHFTPWGHDHFTKLLVQQVEQSFSHNVYHPMNDLEQDEFEWNFVTYLLTIHQGTHTAKWYPSPPPIDHPALRKGIEYLHDHLTSPITLDNICKNAGISKYYFIRLFQKNLGTTPGKYLQKQRLHYAIKLLRHSNQSILSVAFDAGYYSLSTFERAFKKQFGISPMQYRELFS